MPQRADRALAARAAAWWQAAQARFAAPGWSTAARALHIAFLVGLGLWLILKVDAIGWRAVWQSLPATPWFYLLFILMFLALPLSETLIFRMLLGGRLLAHLPIFIRKRIYNSALVGYSGELLYFLWARRNLGRSEKTIALRIKDNALLSALASGAVTAILLCLFALKGDVTVIAHWLDSAAGMLLAGGLALLFVTPLALRLRRQIISTPAREASAVFAIHLARILVIMLLQVTQWWAVLPAEPWTVWLGFLTLQMMISRLPFIPNRDLLFVSAGIELSHLAAGPREAVAGLLLAGGALSQAVNLLFFVITSFERRRRAPEALVAPAEESELARMVAAEGDSPIPL